MQANSHLKHLRCLIEALCSLTNRVIEAVPRAQDQRKPIALEFKCKALSAGSTKQKHKNPIN